MIDINKLRDNLEQFKQAAIAKHKDINFEQIISLDDQRKTLQKQSDDLKHQQKVAGQERNIELAKKLKTDIQKIQDEYITVKEQLDAWLASVPNLIHPDVPDGKDEDDNVVVKTVWDIPTFDFEVKDHQTLGEDLGMIDKEKAAEVTGARFFYLKGDIVKLQYAIIQYTFDTLTNEEVIKEVVAKNNLDVSTKPFQLVIPPLMIKYDTAEKMWRLHPKDDRYCLEQDKLMLIWSAEHSLGPIHMNETFDEKELPVRYVACTPAFRREAWTYGKDTRGILRTHQFDKIEMETFATKENGEGEQDLIVALQCHLVESLWLPYQLIAICKGDMWSIDYRQMDINTYIPAQKTYRETHTSDRMTDFQARRLNIKVKREDGTKEVVHMNDATAFALWRIIIAIMENNQQEDGSIKIPTILQSYMGGQEFIGK